MLPVRWEGFGWAGLSHGIYLLSILPLERLVQYEFTLLLQVPGR